MMFVALWCLLHYDVVTLLCLLHYDVCRLLCLLHYYFCRIITFVALWCLLLIVFVPLLHLSHYYVCCIMMFVALWCLSLDTTFVAYRVCRSIYCAVLSPTMKYLCLRPSIRVSSWETILRSTSPWVFSLFGAIASSSSMKMMAGAFLAASSKAVRRLDSDSPASLDIISGPLMWKKKAPVSWETARAMRVLPVPGGPCSRIPRGGRTPIFCTGRNLPLSGLFHEIFSFYFLLSTFYLGPIW